MRRLDQLTTTRFICMVTVVLYHGLQFKLIPISPILFAGPLSVSYLYVLSGFIMSLVYYKPEGEFDKRSYWIARFARIYPLYIISFLLVCLYYGGDILRIKPPKIFANVFVYQAWIPKYAQSFNIAAWSMAVEVFFYILFPFFVFWARRVPIKRLILYSILFWFFSQSVHFVLTVTLPPGNEDFLFFHPLVHINSFFLGSIGGVWYLVEAPKHKLNPKINLLFLAVTTVLTCIFLVLGEVYPQVPHDLQPLVGIASPAMLVIILCLALDTTRLSEILNHRWLVILGEISYPLYILHVPVRWFFLRFVEGQGIEPTLPFMYLVYFPMTIGMGLLVYFYLDRPTRRWTRNFLESINLPLFVLDLIIAFGSITLGFVLRFGAEKDFNGYSRLFNLLLWVAPIIRISLGSVFKLYSNKALHSFPSSLGIRQLVSSVGSGSALLTIQLFIASAVGWLEGFPRSVLLIEAFIFFTLSFLIRFLSSLIAKKQSTRIKSSTT